jgi:hypothetical protein
VMDAKGVGNIGRYFNVSYYTCSIWINTKNWWF